MKTETDVWASPVEILIQLDCSGVQTEVSKQISSGYYDIQWGPHDL